MEQDDHSTEIGSNIDQNEDMETKDLCQIICTYINIYTHTPYTCINIHIHVYSWFQKNSKTLGIDISNELLHGNLNQVTTGKGTAVYGQ